MTLPPGQHEIGGFPRFGTHLQQPAPAVPAVPAIEVAGAVKEPFSVPLSRLAELPRREQVADLHCVSGWSATGLRWEGVPFAAFYSAIVEPALRPGTTITHVVLRGLDGYRSVLEIEDALGDDVLLAEHLDGAPLDGDHGAPVRFVSPSQYGFLSMKHLCRVELHTSNPRSGFGRIGRFTDVSLRSLIKPHPRARVWEEERHYSLPAWAVRHLYFYVLRPPIAFLSERGSERRRDTA